MRGFSTRTTAFLTLAAMGHLYAPLSLHSEDRQVQLFRKTVPPGVRIPQNRNLRYLEDI